MKIRDWATRKAGAKGPKSVEKMGGGGIMPLQYTNENARAPGIARAERLSNKANAASREISEKRPEERSKADHDKAAERHAAAANAHEAVGNSSRAEYHDRMATDHSSKGSGSIGDQPRDEHGRFAPK